jgi:hypothetical protein
VIRVEIDKLTWDNELQVERDKWVDQLFGQDTLFKELLFLALERAKKVDKK